MIFPKYEECVGYIKLGVSIWSFIEEQISFLGEFFHDRPVITATILSVLLLIVTTISLFSYVIVLRFLDHLHQNKKTRKFALWERTLLPLIDGAAEIPALAKTIKEKDYELFGEFLSPYLKDAKGDYFDRLCSMFREAGLVKRERYQLNNSIYDWRRALAAQRLGEIKPVEAVDDLLKALDHPNITVSLNAAGALLKISHPELAKKAIFKLLKKENLTEELFVEVLLNYGESLSLKILLDSDFSHSSVFSRLKIIDYIGFFRRYEGVSILIEFLKETTDFEETVRLIKALGNLGSHETRPYFLDFLKNESPVIRAQAAKALGEFKEEEDINQLSQLLNDKDWWCRYYSTWAIFQMGETGRKFLKNYENTTEDSFAKDMINQFIARVQ
jgi:HEAT repeat protein